MGKTTGWLKPGAAILVAVAGAVSARAEPLGKEACETLVAEQQGLITAGAKADFARGAEWGKANLSGDRLNKVGRYIEVEEQLSFRCGLAKVRFSLPADEETAVSPPEEPLSPAKASEQAKPIPKAKAKAKAAAADGASAPATGSERPAPAPKVQAKIKPKAKPENAGPEPAKE